MTSTPGRYGPGLLILVAATVCLRPAWFVDDHRRLLREAARAYYFEDFPEAARLSDAVLLQAPDDRQALLIAGNARARLHESEKSIACFDRIPDDGSPESALALAGKGERLLRLGRVRAAEPLLRAALELNPRHFEANRNLSFLLQRQGRTWASLPFIREQIRQGRFRGDELQMLSLSEILFVSDQIFVAECLAALPNDPLPLLARARFTHMRNELEEAEQLLRKIVSNSPNVTEAQARLGQILLEAGRMEEFVQWHAELPPSADLHPEIWFTRGMWAVGEQQTDVAVRCFLEAVARSQNHIRSNYQLSLLLAEMGDHEFAERFSVRADRLSKLELEYVGLINSQRADGMQKTAGILEQLGRHYEAAGMYDISLRVLGGELDWATEGVKRTSLLIDGEESMIVAEANPIRGIDLSQYPLPDIRFTDRSSTQHADVRENESSVTFSDIAEQAGLNFTYFNGSATPKGLNHIFETTGGGVAALDFDGDAWPDLYFSQGGVLPPRTDDFRHRDGLFRNQGGEAFDDVTEVSGVGDHLFGQGVTVGDFNDDGFADLYVANLGRNRLYQNNGDGTFRDVTTQTGVAGNVWTLSCLIADLNGDAWPDVYAVNYLTIESVRERTCRKNGRPQTCAPTLFPAEQDRLYLNLGDGRFKDVTDESGIVHAEGKGLGIIAADFDGSGRLSLFVGNDTATNFYLINETAERGGDVLFRESGLLSGLGVDTNGRAQASMGIAADDANGDGMVDLFVTNFYSDPNTMYFHQSEHQFVDATRRVGLHDPGFNLLGFGTQFLDGELDGYPDLVVTNGHVDRTDATHEPDEMPPQYFRNTGGGQYEEASASTLGPFFEEKYLGRALTRLDWNRDGREDFCVGHLHAPVALVSNQTTGVGHYIAIRLRGVEGDRDAIGTNVYVSTAGRQHFKQLTAGDGYMSSNQRQLVFGLGEADRVTEMVVRWSSGREQTFHDLPVDRELLCVEGRPQVYEFPKLMSEP